VASRQASFRDQVMVSVLLGPLKLVAVVALCGVGLLLYAWAVDWVYANHVGFDGGYRLRSTLSEDLVLASALAREQGIAPDWVTSAANGLYRLVFGLTGILRMGVEFSEPSPLSIPDTVVRNFYRTHWNDIEVLMISTQLMGVRLGALALIAPLLVIAYLVGAIEGLTERAVRKACGGVESSGLYHRGKYALVGILGAMLLVVIGWPTPVDFRGIALVVAGGVALAARLQWSYYKKFV
jgi:hypothetical protein